jgi:hypothetical protein
LATTCGWLHEPLDSLEPARHAGELREQVARAGLGAAGRRIEVDFGSDPALGDERAVLGRRDLSGHVHDVVDEDDGIEGERGHGERVARKTEPTVVSSPHDRPAP